MKKNVKNALLAVSSAAAGLCNSLIGAGGGIILSFCLGRHFQDSFKDKRNIYVNSQAAMIPSCVISCVIYSMKGMLETSLFSPIAIPAIVGGVMGSLLLPKLKLGWLKTAFALLVIWSGFRMMTA